MTAPLYRPQILMWTLILMPIDWFSGTGLLFREAGAKPMNLFSVCWLLLIWLMGAKVWRARVNSRIPLQLILMGIVLWGGVAFLISTLTFEPMPTANRSNVTQFFSQTAMLLLFLVVLQSQIYLFQSERHRVQVLAFLPWAASVHLLFFMAEAVGIFSPDFPGPLAWFRNEFGLIERASGLMSEPSYFGIFAALYAVPLLLFGGRYPLVNRLLALILLVCSFLVQSKSMIIVLAAQLVYLLAATQISKALRWTTWLLITATVPASLYMISTTAAFNLEDNMSSAMRIGSSALAWRVATEGYGLLGIGTGQFHFFYSSNFAPDFLLLSQEALDQISGVSEGRASTFNLPLRLLVEIGLPGLFLAALLLISLFISRRNSKDRPTQIGMCFIAGSLGFLMTQDTYCLPSLAFGLALALTGPDEPSSTSMCRTT